jgi:hypothetical protein
MEKWLVLALVVGVIVLLCVLIYRDYLRHRRVPRNYTPTHLDHLGGRQFIDRIRLDTANNGHLQLRNENIYVLRGLGREKDQIGTVVRLSGDKVEVMQRVFALEDNNLFYYVRLSIKEFFQLYSMYRKNKPRIVLMHLLENLHRKKCAYLVRVTQEDIRLAIQTRLPGLADSYFTHAH